ncbi:MAG: branched-chain amino acid ABC transporter permease [Ktedonobacterales bacterium]
MVDFGQVIVSWLLLGSLYAAVALGFSLVWGVMNVVNLAHGAFIIVGAYVALWAFTTFHLDPFLGIPLAMAVLFTIGYIVQAVAINRLIRAPLLVTLPLTFGLELLVVDIVQHISTPDLRSIGTAYSGIGPTIGSTQIALDRIAVSAIAILLTAALSAFLSRTRISNAMLATCTDLRSSIAATICRSSSPWWLPVISCATRIRCLAVRQAEGDCNDATLPHSGAAGRRHRA